MSTVFLVRHGLTAMTGPTLAGRAPGVHLDERGREQAARLATRLAAVPLAAIVTSPMERCRETIAPLLQARQGSQSSEGGKGAAAAVHEQVDERFIECGYGDWTGKLLAKLAKDPLWKVVQAHPSAVTFPGDGGESLRGMQARAVDGVRDWNARLGPDAVWLACSHGDVIKAVVADALGMHLDAFQRLVADPCSVTVIRYTEVRPFVVRLNDTASDADSLAALAPPPAHRRRRRRIGGGDAVVGGGAGPR